MSTNDNDAHLKEKIESSFKKLKSTYPELPKTLSEYEFMHVIGKGGFGVVKLAKFHKDQKLYAVKEIFAKRLVGNQFRRFLDEIKTMAQCRGKFLLEIAGFTATEPYTIITPFCPNGNLFEAIYSKKIHLNPTQLTKIAMGIAHGMISIHEKKIIHRDLKLPNILLDDNFEPKIADFGIARFELGQAGLMTENIGTPIYMAPELALTKSYSTKVDVFSYALLLWEMSERRPPYNGWLADKIVQRVIHNGEREKFTKATPHKLKMLIRNCWAANPDDRPGFSDIYKIFASGKVAFRDANENEIKKFAEEIEEYDRHLKQEEEKRKEAKGKKDSKKKKVGSNPRSNTIHPIVKQKPSQTKVEDRPKSGEFQQVVVKEDITPQPATVDSNDPVAVLSDYRMSLFQKFAEGYASQINTDSFGFYSNIFKNFSLNPPPEALAIIVRCINTLIERDKKFIQLIARSPYFTSVPLNYDQVLDIIVESFRLLFFEYPAFALSQEVAPQLQILLERRTEKMLILLSHWVQYLQLHTINSLISLQSQLLNSPLGELLLRIVYYNLEKSDNNTRTTLLQKWQALVFAFINSSEIKNIIAAYKIIIVFYKNLDESMINVIIPHLDNIELSIYTQNLLYINSDKIGIESIVKLMEIGQKNSVAWVMIYIVAEKYPDMFPLNGDFWFLHITTQIDYVLRLFFILFHNHSNRDRFLSCQWYYEMLLGLVRARSTFHHMVIPSILTRQTISYQMNKILADNGFMKEYIQQSLDDKESEQLSHDVLVLLDHFTRKVGFCDYSLMFLGQLLQLLSHPNLGMNAFIITSLLTKYPQFCANFPRDEGSYNYFKGIAISDHKCKQFANEIAVNIYSYNQSQFK